MGKRFTLCLSGSIDMISDNDFYFVVNVTDFINKKGNFSPRAEDPSEFFGEQYVEYEVEAVYDDAGLLQEHNKELFLNKFDLQIESLVWDEMVERQYDHRED